MSFRVSPQQAILFTKLSVTLIFTWPPSANSSKLAEKIHDILWYLSFINPFLLFFPLLQSSYVYQDDPFIMAQSICFSAAAIQIPIKMLLCRTLRYRFQELFSEMEQFCTNADEEEWEVLQCYVNRYKILHGMYTIGTYFATTIVVFGPLYLPQSFPCFAVYPFPVDQRSLKTIVYFHQSLVGYQVSAGMNVDCQIAILLWFTTIRFEILSLKIRNLQGGKCFNDCYKYHQDVLRYAQKVQCTVCYLAASTMATTTVGLAFGGINIIRQNTPVMARVQFALVMLVVSLELFMCALPADCLKNASSQIAIDMYNLNWYDRSIKEQTNALQSIMRAQKPEIIRVNGLVSELTLRYYSSFLSTPFSYITTLRVMVDADES